MSSILQTLHVLSLSMAAFGLGQSVAVPLSGLPRRIGHAKGHLAGFAIRAVLNTDRALVSDAVTGKEFFGLFKDFRLAVAGQELFSAGLDARDLRDDMAMRWGAVPDPADQAANQNVLNTESTIQLEYWFSDGTDDHKHDMLLDLRLLDERVDPSAQLRWTHRSNIPAAPAGWTFNSLVSVDVYAMVRYEAAARETPLPVLTVDAFPELSAHIAPAVAGAITRLDYAIGRPTAEEAGGQDVSTWLGITRRVEDARFATQDAVPLGVASALTRRHPNTPPTDMTPGVGYLPFFAARPQSGASDLPSADIGWGIQSRNAHARTRVLHRQRVAYTAPIAAKAAQLRPGKPEQLRVTTTPQGLLSRKLK